LTKARKMQKAKLKSQKANNLAPKSEFKKKAIVSEVKKPNKKSV